MNKSLKWKLTTALIAVAAVLLTLAAFTAPFTAYAESKSNAVTNIVTNFDADSFIDNLSTLNAEKDTEGARNYVIAKFREALGEPADVSNADSKVNIAYGSNTAYLNIEARIDKGTDKYVIIGAHYDAVGAGADDNVCGIASLYLTMKILKQCESQLPYSVVFVAFDGEEEGLLGSTEYVKNIQDKSNVAVMFNIDSIASGDNLYLMCENKSTALANLILTKSNDITEKPYAKGTNGLMDKYGYGYYEDVQASDHTPFRLAGIPVAFFFSGTYDAEIWGFSQSSDASKRVWNTDRDTYDNLGASGVNYNSRIQTVASAIAETVLDDEFTTVATNARKDLVNLNLCYNDWWPSLIVLGILLILVVFTVLYNRKLQKQAILGTAEIKMQKIFEKPSAEEIFTFKD